MLKKTKYIDVGLLNQGSEFSSFISEVKGAFDSLLVSEQQYSPSVIYSKLRTHLRQDLTYSQKDNLKLT